MKTKGDQNTKVNVVTLGCAKNLVDSENIITQLRGNDIETLHEANEGFNVVIVNTCGFIDNAKQESVDTILQYAEAKNNNLIDKLYVTGCLSERYKSNLEDEIPEVDAFFGTREVPALLKKFNADYKHELIGERITTTAAHYSYLKISEGCDRPCSFCAIPLMRGKHISRPIEELVKEATHLASKGTKELILIAQDLTFYGLDIYKKRELSKLLEALSRVEGIEWIRLHYAYPSGFPMDVIDTMKSKRNICNYLDIPLQHGSSKILQSMKRGIDREKTEKLVADIRAKVPDIAIRTTLIAGYPGETEEEFQEMYDFVEKMRFDRLGVFTYSHEENTTAHALEDDVPEEVKESRKEQIMELQEQISYELNQKRIGKCYKVLIDRKEGEYFVGRTEFDSPDVDNEVLISAKENYLRQGDFVEVKIFDASHFDLYGEVVK